MEVQFFNIYLWSLVDAGWCWNLKKVPCWPCFNWPRFTICECHYNQWLHPLRFQQSDEIARRDLPKALEALGLLGRQLNIFFMPQILQKAECQVSLQNNISSNFHYDMFMVPIPSLMLFHVISTPTYGSYPILMWFQLHPLWDLGQVYVSSRTLACSCLEICHAAEKPAGEINGNFVKVRKDICKTTWTLHFYNSNLFVTVCNLILQD